MGETGQTGLLERSALTGYTMRETGRTGLRERSAHTGSTMCQSCADIQTLGVHERLELDKNANGSLVVQFLCDHWAFEYVRGQKGGKKKQATMRKR